MMIKTPIEIDGKTGIIEQIYITELQYLMVKVYFPDRKIWISYNMGKFYDVLPLEKIKANGKDRSYS